MTDPFPQPLSEPMRETNGKPAAERRVLSRKEAFDLMTWVSTRREFLGNQKYTLEQCAQEARAALSFPRLTTGHLRGAYRDLGIETPRRRGNASGSNVGAAVRARVEALETRVEQLESRLAEEARLRQLAEARILVLEKDVAPCSVARK